MYIYMCVCVCVCVHLQMLNDDFYNNIYIHNHIYIYVTLCAVCFECPYAYM